MTTARNAGAPPPLEQPRLRTAVFEDVLPEGALALDRPADVARSGRDLDQRPRAIARFVRMTRRGIHYNRTVVAMAREFMGDLWATLSPRETEAPPAA